MAVVIDIETLDLLHKIPLPEISCVCIFEVEIKKQHRIQLLNISKEKKDIQQSLIVSILNSATYIIGYNIVLFDLEFIKRSFGEKVSKDLFNNWVCKSIDLFMVLKYVIKSTCPLNELLRMNHIGSKTDCGKNAITMAMNNEWESLMDYCMSDVMLTYQLFLKKNSEGISLIRISDNCWIYWKLNHHVKEIQIKTCFDVEPEQEIKTKSYSKQHENSWKECKIQPTNYLCIYD